MLGGIFDLIYYIFMSLGKKGRVLFRAYRINGIRSGVWALRLMWAAEISFVLLIISSIVLFKVRV